MSKTRRKSSKTQSKQLTDAAEPSLLPDLAFPDLAICLGLILCIFAVYAQVGHFDFINYDDDSYVYNNVHIQDGLKADSIKWAFTAVVASNWMPVTLLSHILDVQFFGLQSGSHHLTNVIFHALSAVLLFVVLQRTTRARVPSAFVAFMFALHPLHLESVAWVAERKDVLSAFFFFLALYFYVRYTERPGWRRYMLVVGLFCLGLMSKPMLVTFPFTLLLFDVWPLRRVEWPKILWEKVPLLAVSAVASAVTYLVQRSAGAVQTIPVTTRIENALISYVTYIGQTFWPARLAVFYPYPKSIALWQAAAACTVILGASAVALLARRERPYFTTGWFWYVGTLVPVIGLVQVGTQSHADRYTYIPMIGLSVILAWGGAEVVRKWPRTKTAAGAAASIFCAALMAATWTQAAYWRNSESLFQHAIETTGENWLAQGNLGVYLINVPERRPDAISHLEAALRIKPDYVEAHNNLGLALLRTPGRDDDAMAQYEAALRLKPDNEVSHNNLGLLLAKHGRTEEAIAHFAAAVRLNPDYRNERNLGVELATVPGRESDAIAHLEAAQRLHPDPQVAKTLDRLRAAR